MVIVVGEYVSLVTFRNVILLSLGCLFSGLTMAAPSCSFTLETLKKLEYFQYSSPIRVGQFLIDLKKAAKDRDFVYLASQIHYPFTTYHVGKVIKTYNNQSDVLSDSKNLFTPQVLQAIESQRCQDIFFRDQGVMIGDGQVWLTEYNSKELKIKAINATT